MTLTPDHPARQTAIGELRTINLSLAPRTSVQGQSPGGRSAEPRSRAHPMPRRKTKAQTSASAPSAPSPTPSPFLTTAEVAQRLRVSVRSVERLHKIGKLTAYRIGVDGQIRYRVDDVDRLLVPDYGAARNTPNLTAFISRHINEG